MGKNKDYREYSGKKFNKLTIINVIPSSEACHKVKALCKCECGKEKVDELFRVIRGYVKDCGCGRASSTKDYTSYIGKKYGKLRILEILPREYYLNGKRIKPVRVLCECECGRERKIHLKELWRGQKSCGCLRGRKRKNVEQEKVRGI